MRSILAWPIHCCIVARTTVNGIIGKERELVLDRALVYLPISSRIVSRSDQRCHDSRVEADRSTPAHHPFFAKYTRQLFSIPLKWCMDFSVKIINPLVEYFEKCVSTSSITRCWKIIFIYHLPRLEIVRKIVTILMIVGRKKFQNFLRQ